MSRGLQNFPNIVPPSSDYPSGKIKDRTSSAPGTPVNEFTNGDLQQLVAKLMSLAAITPNGLPDNETNQYQYLEALLDLLHTNVSSDLVAGYLRGYTTGQLVIMWGCVITGSVPGTSSITAGAAYYNGKLYKVPAASVITITGQVLVFKINASLQPDIIYLTAGGTGSGICDATATIPFNPVRTDRQTDFNDTYNTNVPTSGTESQVGATLTAAPGVNRDYKLEFTWCYNKITTDPETYIIFFKNGSPLFSFHSLPSEVGDRTTSSHVHFLDKNAPPGTTYSVMMANSGSNQYHMQSYVFSIDGQI